VEDWHTLPVLLAAPAVGCDTRVERREVRFVPFAPDTWRRLRGRVRAPLLSVC
jgi:hypothetical protein